MKNKLIALICVLVAAWVQTNAAGVRIAASEILYVKKGATGTGGSWANAMGELADALKYATTNTYVKQIWVAGGTYNPKYNASGVSATRESVFVLVSGVKLYGGFAGTEGAVTERHLNDPANRTILSGNISDLSSATDNCYRVVQGVDLSSSTVIDGFTISDGYANGSESNPTGTGMQVKFGAGMYLLRSPLEMNNIKFYRNYSLGEGGALFTDLYCNPVISKVVFAYNISDGGGGAFFSNNNYNVNLDSVQFFGNRAAGNGGALFIATASDVKANKIAFQGNFCTGANATGGAVVVGGTTGNISFTNVLVIGNQAASAGGISISDANTTLTNVTISGNISGAGGSGFNFSNNSGSNKSLTINNSVIHGNKGEGYKISGTKLTSVIRNSLIASITQSGTPEKNIDGSADPMFEYEVSNLTGAFSGGDYRLKSGSPLIDAGSNQWYTDAVNSTDLAENPRVYNSAQNGIIDIGAYEYTPVTPKITPDAAGVVYIKKGATGDGSSWGNATGELADVLLAAQTNTTIRQIWVTAGTYYPKYDATGVAVNDRNQTFLLVNGVKLYGGFNGTETDITQRDLSNAANATILSGDVGTVGTQADNCYHVLFGYNLNADTELDGFSITGGYADGTGSFTPAGELFSVAMNNGSGMWVNKADIRLRNLEVYGNECGAGGFSGGSIYFTGNSNPVGTNLTIHDNKGSNNQYGGFYIVGGSLMLSKVSFRNNQAKVGAGLYVSDASCGIVDGEFIGNNALTLAGGADFQNAVNISLNNIRFKGNSSGSGGGALVLSGPLSNTVAVTASLTDVLFSGNSTGTTGGAIYMLRYGARLTNVTIAGNKASNGGGIYMRDGKNTQTLSIRNSVISGNSQEIETGTATNTPDIRNSLVAGITTPDTDKHNLDGASDPKFADASDFSLAPFSNGDYSVQAGSVLINAGDTAFYPVSSNTTDIAGNPRVHHFTEGGIIDIGAYESLTTQIPVSNISASDITTDYASENVGLTVTSISSKPLSFVSNDTAVAAPYRESELANEWKLKIKKAGVATVTAIQPADNYYETAQKPFLVSVKKMLLTVTMKDSTKAYNGQAFSAGKVIYSGFVRGEDEQVLGGALAYTGDAQGAVNAGSYKIEATGLVSDNYDFDYLPGKLIIKKLPLTIAAKDASKTYDGLAFTGGNGVNYSGFVNGEDEQVLSGTLSYGGDAQQAVNSGEYKITPSGFSASNYTLSYTDGVLHITPAPLIVTAKDVTKDYDGKAFSQGGGVSYSGFVNGETEQVVSGTAVYGGDAQGATNAGNYTISVNGLVAANYQLSYADGQLNIQKLPLTATAKDASRTYNGLAFTGGNGITYSGFVNGENESVFSGTVTYGGDAQDAVNAGEYSITASGLTADNYTVNFKPGKLTIAKAVLTVTARDAGKVYNGQPFSNGNGVDYSGFMQGENESVLKNQLSYTGTSQGAINAGDYVITPGGYTADNYALQYVSGTLTISKAVLSVRPDDEARCYGLANPVFTVQYKGFVNGETEAVLPVKPTAATTAGATTTAGVYDITVTGGTAVNYTLNLLKGALTIYALPESELTATQGKILCGDNAVIPLTASGPYNFNWYRSDVMVNGASGSVLNVNSTGTYSARATDSHGCSAPVRNEIVVTRQLPSTADFSFNQYCAGNTIAFTNLSQGAGNSSYNYQWQTSAGNSAGTYHAGFSFAGAGDYTVTLTVTPAGCASLAQSFTKHIQIEQPIPGITLPARSAAAGSGIVLEARKLANASYNWMPASGLSDYSSDRTTATLLRSQTYLVNMNFPSGCTTVDTLAVTVTNMAAVLVPNVFTPNGDGNNDVLLPNLKGVKQLRYFRVFNRAGKKVFESTDVSAGWDGRLQGVLQPFDTYVWTSEGVDYNGNTVRNQGSVTLLR